MQEELLKTRQLYTEAAGEWHVQVHYEDVYFPHVIPCG